MALIRREDFEVEGEEQAGKNITLTMRNLEADDFFFQSLRKPDFQRETSEWDPAKVVGLIKTFLDEDLIPGVILWRWKEYVFVIDGSHRLSALIAWVQDDYGDGKASREFYKSVSDDQLKIAEATRNLVNREVRSFAEHKLASANPDIYPIDLVTRARRLGSNIIYAQWVTGDAAKAEKSFIRINQKAVIITPQELEFIEQRKKPAIIATRAIIRQGTGHKYWSNFADDQQGKTEEIARELHTALFVPSLNYPIKTLDLPAGGQAYSGQALQMVYNLIKLAVVEEPSNDPDLTGDLTIEYLNRTRQLMRLVLSTHQSSLGLHPAVYFYSWTGNQQPVLFLAIAELVLKWDIEKQFVRFIKYRADVETFLTANKNLIAQIVRKLGAKTSGRRDLGNFVELTIDLLADGVVQTDLVDRIRKNGDFAYLQPAEEIRTPSKPGQKFSTAVKSGAVIQQLLPTAKRCAVCGGFVPMQAMSLDHKHAKSDGGSAAADNAQITHPYCNSNKENLLAMLAKKSGGQVT